MSSKIKNFLTPETILLSIIIALATLLRLYRLGDDLWFDEIITYINYGNLPFNEIATTFNSENNHVLYSHFAHASILIFGQHGWALRLPAVLFGIGSLLGLYSLGRLLTDKRETYLAILLLTLSYHHIWFSQNARGYTALLFWTILSTYFLLRGLNENRRILWLLYGLTAALGMYTHLTMGFVIAGQFLAYLYQAYKNSSIKEWRKLEGIWIGFASAGFLTLVLYAPLAGKISSAMDVTLTGVPEIWNSPLWTILETIKGLQIGLSQVVILLGALFLVGVGIIAYFRTHPAFILTFLLPPIIGSLVTIAMAHPLWPRFFFFAAGFGALIVIRGAMAISIWFAGKIKLSPKSGIQLGTIIGVIMILASAWSVRNVYGPKQDYIGAMQYVNSKLNPGDSVVIVNLTIPPYQEYLRTGWQAIESIDDLKEIQNNSNRTWILVTFPNVLEASFPNISQVIQSEFQLAKTFWGTVGDGQVYVYLYENLTRK